MNLIPRDSLFDMLEGFPVGFTSRLNNEGVFSPSVDVREQDDQYLIKADLPGIDKDHLNVTLENGNLTIDATMEDESKDEEDGKLIRRERRYGRFTRSFYVGENVTESDINASFKDGVLNLEIPKKEPTEPEKRRITVS